VDDPAASGWIEGFDVDGVWWDVFIPAIPLDCRLWLFGPELPTRRRWAAGGGFALVRLKREGGVLTAHDVMPIIPDRDTGLGYRRVSERARFGRAAAARLTEEAIRQLRIYLTDAAAGVDGDS
jgi:hypothetical protein